MRAHGTLAKWNEERGFGFIAPASGAAEIFVHVSAFPRDGVRPRIGELISFEIETRADGKKRAVRIMRPAVRALRPTSHASSRSKTPLVAAMGLVVFGALSIYAFVSLKHQQRPNEPVDPPTAARALIQAPVESFSCDGRTRCSQMRSCEEAQFFLKNCPNTQMDGDHDGVPCEQQWCS